MAVLPPARFMQADALIEKYRTGGPSAQVVAASIEAKATLALADQQRVANLIALAGYADADIPDSLNELAHLAVDELRASLGNGLGIYPTNDE